MERADDDGAMKATLVPVKDEVGVNPVAVANKANNGATTFMMPIKEKICEPSVTNTKKKRQ